MKKKDLLSRGWRFVVSNDDDDLIFDHPNFPLHRIIVLSGGLAWRHIFNGKVIAGSHENAGTLRQWLNHFHFESRDI